MTFQPINFRRIGKMYHRFCQYIAAIRSGRESIMFGEGYVVLSMKHYEELRWPKTEISFFGVDPGKGSGLVGCSLGPAELERQYQQAFELQKLEIPDRVAPWPHDRKTPAQRCNYSTKVR